ncbi:MAG: AAA family ATPase [Kineosporiaceae bacterium]
MTDSPSVPTTGTTTSRGVRRRLDAALAPLVSRLPAPARERPLVTVLAVLVPLVALLSWLALGTASTPTTTPVPLSQAVAEVGSGRVTSAVIDEGASTVTLTLRDGARHEASFPAAYAQTLTGRLVDAKVELESERGGAGGSILAALAPIALIGVLLLLLVRVQGGQVRAIGGTKAAPVDVPDTSFDDVAGCPEAITDLAEIADLLRDPAKYTATGARIPRGYLLVGPPGTGKTLLARAVAGEAGVPFFSTSGADFSDMYVGIGKKRIRTLFAQARKAAAAGKGAVVFFDEIDAVGGARQSVRRDSASDDRDATLIALLTEMDGFSARGDIVVLAATNRPDALDPALTRPGRFDRQIAVPAPDPAGRAAILAVHARKVQVTPDVDLVALGRRTPGFVGADLESLVNEAALEAGRRGLPAADPGCFEEALATAAMGRARTSAVITDRDRRITAWHEAGHTVMALVEPHADDPVSVTIVPRGISGGTTWMGGNDHSFMTREQAYARLAVALGGRAAEELALDGSFSQGAAGDLQSATQLAIAMATEYGMTRLGLARRPVVGTELPTDVLEVVNELLAQALDTARSGLARHRALVDAVVEGLLEHETLTQAQLRELASRFELPAAGDAHVPGPRHSPARDTVG